MHFKCSFISCFLQHLQWAALYMELLSLGHPKLVLDFASIQYFHKFHWYVIQFGKIIVPYSTNSQPRTLVTSGW
jgi:hypothetical protein